MYIIPEHRPLKTSQILCLLMPFEMLYVLAIFNCTDYTSQVERSQQFLLNNIDK